MLACLAFTISVYLWSYVLYVCMFISVFRICGVRTSVCLISLYYCSHKVDIL